MACAVSTRNDIGCLAGMSILSNSFPSSVDINIDIWEFQSWKPVDILTWHCFLPSTLFSFLRLNLSYRYKYYVSGHYPSSCHYLKTLSGLYYQTFAFLVLPTNQIVTGITVSFSERTDMNAVSFLSKCDKSDYLPIRCPSEFMNVAIWEHCTFERFFWHGKVHWSNSIIITLALKSRNKIFL
jgi:hypothetical protein